jgi:hypothetical protein
MTPEQKIIKAKVGVLEWTNSSATYRGPSADRL